MRHERKISLMLILVLVISLGASTVEAVRPEVESSFIVNSPVEMPIKVYIDGVYEEDFILEPGENSLDVGLDNLDGPEMFWIELDDDYVGRVELLGSAYKGKTFGLPVYYGGNIYVDFVEVGDKVESSFIVNSPVKMPIKVYIDGVYEEDFILEPGENSLDVGLDNLDGPEMFWLELDDDYVGRVELLGSAYKGKTFGLPVYYGGNIYVDFVETHEDKDIEFELSRARLVDDFELILEYSKEISEVDFYQLEFKHQLELIDSKGEKIALNNYRLEEGRLLLNYDRHKIPTSLNIKSDGIFTSLDGDKSRKELNLELTDNRPEIIGAGVYIEKLNNSEIRVNIAFSEELDIFSLLANMELVRDGESLKTNKKFNKTDTSIGLGFNAKDIRLGDRLSLSFKGVETLAGRPIDSMTLERTVGLDRELDRKLDRLSGEMEDYIFDLTSPLGPMGLAEELNQKNYWPTPAFETALESMRDKLDGMKRTVGRMEKDIESIELISGSEYEKLIDIKKDRDYINKSVNFLETELVPRGDYIIGEANKTEAIKRRMRDIAYRLHKHRVHSLLLEPEKLDELLESMPGEREEAARIELDYMKKMALDDIDEMEAKLKVVKLACDFYLEEDLDLAYSQIENVKKELMRLPADIGNELYDFIEDKINLAIEYHKAQGDVEAEGVFKVEDVRLLDGNIVEFVLSNPISWYDQHFKDTNCMFVLKTSDKEGYENFVSVEKTEIDLKGRTVRLSPRDGVVPSHFEVPSGVPIKDSRGMTPEKMGISKITDLRTK